MTDWTVLAVHLADELTKSGKLWSAPWQAAVRAVPRHELVPVHYQRQSGSNGPGPAQRSIWSWYIPTKRFLYCRTDCRRPACQV